CIQSLLAGLKIGPNVGSCGTAAHERRDVISPDIMIDPLWEEWRSLFEPLGVRACWSRPVYAADGKILAVFGFYFRVTRVPSDDELENLDNLRHLASVAIEKARIGQALRESEEHYRHTVEHNPQIPWTADSSGKILSASSRWTEATGLSVESAQGDGWLKALHLDDIAGAVASWSHAVHTGQDLDIKYRLRLQDGTYRWVRARAVARRDDKGRIIKWYGAAEDINELELAAERLRTQADHDDLTHLFNRRGFEQFLRSKLNDLPTGDSVGLAAVDIGGFKHVNDRFGHETGDAALRLFGRHLRSCVGHRDVVARIAGDEFAVAFDRSIEGADLQERATKLAGDLNRHLGRSAKTRNCMIRVGCATSEPLQKVEELLRRAKLALYAAKRDAHRPVKLFTPAIRQAVDERSTQIELAKEALDSRWVVPFYQPMVSLESGSIAGAEALLRIAHPLRGILSPASVWAALDAPKAGKAISDRMIAAILDDLSGWAIWPDGMGTISINLSTETLLQVGFARAILQKIKRKGIAPCQVTVEITERVLIDDLAPVSRQGLLELQRHGMRVSLDDFGTGYASLTHLRKLPVNEIKIDQSFVKDLSDGGPNAAIVKSMIALGLSMGVDVVAEGVETAEQATLLLEWGCRFAQGYYFFKPMPAAEFGRLLESQSDHAGGTAINSPPARKPQNTKVIRPAYESGTPNQIGILRSSTRS
ncbi:EAL domain-containing protein, partial [bacterium]